MSANIQALLRFAAAQRDTLLDYGRSDRELVQRQRIKHEWQTGKRQQIVKTLRDLLLRPELGATLAELAEAATTWVDQRLPDELWQATLDAALRAPLADSPIREAHLRIARAKRSLRRADFASASVDAAKARELAEAAGAERTQLTAQSLLGEIAACRGDYRASLEHHRLALTIAERIGDDQLRLEAQDNLAVAYAELRDNAQAERLHRAVLEQAKNTGQIEIALRASNNLAILYRLQGKIANALEMHSGQLRLAREHKILPAEAQALNGVGLVHESMGSHQTALDYFDQALRVRRALGDLRGEAITLMSAGISLRNLGKIAEARVHFAESLERAERIGDPRACGQALNQLCNAAIAEGQLADAKQLAERNLAWARSASDPVAEGTALYTLFRVLVHLQDPTAIDALEAAVKVLRRADFAQGLSNALNALGRQRLAAVRPQEARLLFEEALALSYELKNPRQIVRDLLCLATCDGALQQPQRGLQQLERAEPALVELSGSVAVELREQLEELRQDLERDRER